MTYLNLQHFFASILMTKVVLDLCVLLLSELIKNLLICSLSDSLTHSLTHSFIHLPSLHSLTRSLAHWFIHKNENSF